jgi:hypothetical protein
LPEPGHFWIAYAPRSWRCDDQSWTDLARATLGGLEAGAQDPLPVFKEEEWADLFYLPPVAPTLVAGRDRLAQSLLTSGTPVLVQLRLGEVCPMEGVKVIYDLLPILLDGGLQGLKDLPAGCSVVWPLIAGLSDSRQLWDEACDLMAMAQVEVVQPMLLELTPPMRRGLAEGKEDGVFDAIFHGQPPSERDFSRTASQHGLEIFSRRPASGKTPRVRSNREIAAQLALVGELWLRLRLPEGQGQAYLRAARGAERSQHDLAALVREENLRVMDWLDATNVGLIEEIVRNGRTELLATLLGQYQAKEGS